MKTENIRIGRHISIQNGFVKSADRAATQGCSVFQIFTASPRSANNRSLNITEIKKFAANLEKNHQLMVIHSNYLINLANQVRSFKFKKSVASLKQDLETAEWIGDRCLGVVVHMGKNITSNAISDEQAMQNYLEGVKQALSTTRNTYLILETGASQGTEIASKIEGMAEIYWRTPENYRTRLRFCIDTCHIWATGYDIGSAAGVKKYFQKFRKYIGTKTIACIHFNDSLNRCNSHVDRHADLGYGLIPVAGLQAVAAYAARHGIPIIAETPLDHINAKQELTIIKNWCRTSF